MEQKAEIYFYHTDALGSVTALTDGRQKNVQEYEYSSFGELKSKGNKVKQPYTYTGREWDEEIGLYFYRARYYLAETGRFISVDPLLHSEIGQNSGNRGCGKTSLGSTSSSLFSSPTKLNPYVYVSNNPIITEPTIK